jgi:hypothetical protein
VKIFYFTLIELIKVLHILRANSPNNNDKTKLKQLQCCQLGALKYIYSEISTLDVQNKKSKQSLILFTNMTKFWLKIFKQHRIL